MVAVPLQAAGSTVSAAGEPFFGRLTPIGVTAQLVIGLVLLSLVFAIAMVRRSAAVSQADAQALLVEGGRLVDVRSPSEFATGHLEGAINLPVEELAARADELGPPDAGLVLYCRSGARSALAKRRLEARGFNNVHDFGAMARWRRS